MLIPGKVAIVTGAAQGIGKAISEAFLQNDGKVCLSDVNEEAGTATLNELKGRFGWNSCVFFKCDVTDKKQFKELFTFAHKTFERVDILCNNAGIAGVQTLEKFDQTININLVSMITGCMLAVESFKEDGGGAIVNVASAAALGPMPDNPVYAASKWGILGYSRSLALAPGISDIPVRVNVLCPTFVRTPMTKDLDKLPATHPMRKSVESFGLLEPERVAEGFIELIRDDDKNGAALFMSEKHGFQYK